MAQNGLSWAGVQLFTAAVYISLFYLNVKQFNLKINLFFLQIFTRNSLSSNRGIIAGYFCKFHIYIILSLVPRSGWYKKVSCRRPNFTIF